MNAGPALGETSADNDLAIAGGGLRETSEGISTARSANPGKDRPLPAGERRKGSRLGFRGHGLTVPDRLDATVADACRCDTGLQLRAGAIYFHDDDLEDAGWDTFRVADSAGLASGLRGAREVGRRGRPCSGFCAAGGGRPNGRHSGPHFQLHGLRQPVHKNYFVEWPLATAPLSRQDQFLAAGRRWGVHDAQDLSYC